MIVFLIAGLLIGGVAVTFAFQNITTITVTFFVWRFEGSLALVILLAIVSGVLLSTLMSLPGTIKKGFQISSLKNRNSKLEKELIDKKKEIESEKSKVAANNARLNSSENTLK